MKTFNECRLIVRPSELHAEGVIGIVALLVLVLLVGWAFGSVRALFGF